MANRIIIFFNVVVQLDKAVIGATFQQKWSELQKLLERQRANGGIIDPEVESNRFLIRINEVRGHQVSISPQSPDKLNVIYFFLMGIDTTVSH